MILQEESTVTFDPQCIWIHPAWYESLFRLFLLVVLLVLLARIVQLTVSLVRLHRFQRASDGADELFRTVIDNSRARARSLRQFAALTCLVAVAEFCMGTSNVLWMVATMKTSGYGAVSGAMSQQFSDTAIGLLLCAALYGTSAFFKSRIARRERAFASPSKSASPASSAKD